MQDKTGINGRFSEDIVRTIIFNLLLETAEIINSEILLKSSEGNNLFLKFTQLVQNNVIRHKDIQYYADQLFVTGKHLIKSKRASGKTPHQKSSMKPC